MGAEDVLTITSFGFPGKLTFGTISTAEAYRVEWAPSPSGPWTNFTGASGAALDFIPGPGSGIVTCSVPMFYRVVATVTNGAVDPPPMAGDYMVIHLAEGPSATSYPVSFLASVPVGGWTDAYKTTNIVLRRMPAGAFTMGSPNDELGRNNDEASHQVTLSKDFYIGVFEVTQKQWERVMGTWPGYFNNAAYRDSRPVESVSYQDIRGASAGANWPATNTVDASSFLGKLRERTGRDFDLPTECQWEYACRANVNKALNSDFNLTNIYFDAHMSEVGRYWYNGGSAYTQNGATNVGTAKVGSYLANAWGLYDCHGNAWEWCLDRYGAYIGDVSDYLGADTGTTRVFRGGGWVFFADGCRSARRGYDVPVYSSYNVGLRLAVPPDPDP
jgi:formylglycine-generating enzyme required for sulfatase activity